jgi:hypothetical protein
MWSRWLGLLARREAGTSLALFRIACGLVVFSTILDPLLRGVLADVWLDQRDGGYRELATPPWLFRLLGGVHPATLWLVVACLLASSAALVLGLGGRLTAFVVLQLYLAVSHINWHTGGCDDKLIGNALWLLVLSRSTATLSLDCRLRSGSWTSTRLVSAWPRYLAIYQLVLVYFTAALQKVSIHWSPAGGFSALYFILQEPSWQRWDMSWLAWVYPLTQLATAATWLWELSAPLLFLDFWYRGTRERPGRMRALFNRLNFRRLFVVLGVLMHLGVFVLIGLGPFTWITLSFYVCLYHPDEWPAWLRNGERRSAGTGAPGVDSEARTPRYRFVAGLVCAFVTAHVVAVTLLAFPAPEGAMDRADWKGPLAQEEFQSWADSLTSWGADVSSAELEDWLWGVAQGYMSVRETLLWPFRPYYSLCGTSQGWRMFVGPNLYPSHLHIDIEENGKWRPVYIERDPDHNWLGDKLDHEHFRTAIFTMIFFEYHRHYAQFARWVARHAARSWPEAARVRVRVYKYRTPGPTEVRENRRPPGQFVQEVELSLEMFRKSQASGGPAREISVSFRNSL